MAKLSEIKLPNNVTYEFKDADAERALSETIRNTVSNQVELIEIGEYDLGTMTIIISSDGFVTASGTTTDDITFRLTSALSTSGSKFFLMGGEGDSNTWWVTLSDAGHNYTVYDTTPADVTTVSGGYINLHIKAGASIEANFAPILLKSSLYAMGVRYGQYAPTNRELYESMNSAQSDIDKMNIDAGSATNPIYFADGVPTPCTYTVEKSVPSDAVFTDTTYESKSAASGGTAVSLVTTGEKYTWNNKQNALSSSNKLNPSYINYDSTHRAVTDAEKSTWNGKQDALTFDSAPTSDSTNPVTSGGVYTPMAELVDRDGKNLLINDSGTKSVGTITFTMNDDRSITVSGTSRTSNSDYYICTNMPLKAGTYVLSGCPSGGNNSNTYKIQINGVGYDIGDSYEFTLSSDTTITVYIRIWSGYTPNNLVFKPMICTKSDWIISKAYVPNALSNLELTQYHTGKMLSSNIDLDTLVTEGTWYGFNAVGNSASNLPVPNGNFNLRVENVMVGGVYLRQSCYIAQIQHVYTEFVRVKNVSSGGAWQPWLMVIAQGAAGLNLVSNDDLNDYTTPGIYQCSGPTVGATLSNSPTSQPFRMEVKYFATTSSIIQEISGINDTTSGECEIYYRVKLSSGWKSWVKISKDMPSTYELGTSLASNSDLNSLTTPGKWYATSTAIADTISHSPVSGVAFFGETIPSVAGSRYIQILYPNDDSGDWYKRRYTGSWQVWVKYTGTPMT